MAVQQQLLVPSRIDIPLILRSLGYNEHRINHHQDKYNYILHKILEQRVFNSAIEADGYSPLHLNTLRTFLGRRDADRILKELLELGIIQCDFLKLYGEYGNKSYGYRIAPAYISKATLRLVFKEEVFGKKLRQQAYIYKQQHSKSTTWKNLKQVGIHAQQAYNFIEAKLDNSILMLAEYQDVLSVKLDKSQAETILVMYNQVLASYAAKEDSFKERHTHPLSLYPSSSVYSLIAVHLVKKALQNTENKDVTLENYLLSLFINKYDADKMSIHNIDQEKYFLEQPDPLSRIFTNVSNLSSELRQFLFYKQDPTAVVVNLDIRNSQPYLLSLLLMDKYQGQVVPDTVQRYIEKTANGTFYEHMMELMGIDPNAITKRSRSAFKKTFFARIFFCKTHYSRCTPEGKVFRREFREVADLIDAYKVREHGQLAILMQRREAAIILKVIGAELQKRHIWHTTIHDSVVVMQAHQEVVKELILASFLAAVGVAPTVSPEPLTPKSKVRTSGAGQRDEVEALLQFSEELLVNAAEQDLCFSELDALETYEVAEEDDFWGD